MVGGHRFKAVLWLSNWVRLFKSLDADWYRINPAWGEMGVEVWRFVMAAEMSGTGVRSQESGVRIFDGRERRMDAGGWGRAGAAEM